MKLLRSRRISCLLVSFLWTACASSPPAPPETLTITGTFRPAAGLSPADFDIWSPGEDVAGTIAADGSYSVTVSGRTGGIVFSGPRAGSASAATAGAGNGLYMTASIGTARFVGPPYAVDGEGTATMDATTTVLSLMMLHPMLAHPSASVMRQQAEWLANRLKAGWPEVTEAARLYDESLSAGANPFANSQFVAAFQQALAAVEADMPAFAPDEPWASSQALSTEDFVKLSNGGKVVSTLQVTSADTSGVSLKPGTVRGTGIDYYFVVRALPVSDFPDWTDSQEFKSPPVLVTRTQPVISAGFIPATSYFSYIDIVKTSIKLLTSVVTTPVQPSKTIDFPAGKMMYDIRFFSGGLGLGASAIDLDFVAEHYTDEERTAFNHNIAAGVVEAIYLIPGAQDLLGDDVGAVVLQEAIIKLIANLESVISAKGIGGVEMNDIYSLTFDTVKAAVDKWIEKSTQQTQEAAWKRFISWVGWGGKEAVKLIMTIPGKVAKGGALANRAARLTAPYSIMEVWLAAVEGEGSNQLTGSFDQPHCSDSFNTPPCLDTHASWTIKCPNIRDTTTLPWDGSFTDGGSCPINKGGTLEVETTAAFQAESWRKDLGTSGDYTIIRGKSFELIVPRPEEQYFSRQNTSFPLSVTALGSSGLQASWTFTAPEQTFSIDVVYQVTFETQNFRSDGTPMGEPEPKSCIMYLGELVMFSR